LCAERIFDHYSKLGLCIFDKISRDSPQKVIGTQPSSIAVFGMLDRNRGLSYAFLQAIY
jgi:hypothetical protein